MSQKQGHIAPRTFASVDDLLKDKSVQTQIARALPKGMDADRMMRIAVSAVSRQPLLRQCTPMSVGLSIIRAAEQGLQCDGWEGHLVPYKNKGVYECQFIADYKGMAKLAYQSELVVECHAEVICENDDFDYEKGTNTFLRWKPAQGGRGKMLGAWAGAKLKNGGFPFIVMWRDEIMQHKAKSTAAKSDFSPWNTPEGEPWMWKKTVFRALCKFLPRSSQLLDLLKAEDADENGKAVIDGVLAIPSDEGTKADKIAGRLAGPKNEPEAAEADPAPETTASSAPDTPENAMDPLAAIEARIKNLQSASAVNAYLAGLEQDRNAGIDGALDDLQWQQVIDWAEKRRKYFARGERSNKQEGLLG